MTDDELRNLIASNAKAIEALTHYLSQEREERQQRETVWEKDRRRIYDLLGLITRAQSDFYATQADFYERFDRLEERQARMTEILDRLDPHDRP
jgi:flagellar capping protein FliD